MLRSRKASIFFYVLIAIESVALCACAKPEQPIKELPPPSQEAQTQPIAQPEPTPPEPSPSLPPPKPAEVEEAVKRVFKDAAIIDSSRDTYFVVGDFNGDLSQDIAVVVKPAAGMLPEINHELANWMRGDPLKDALPDPAVLVQQHAEVRSQPVQMARDDVLLAVIHGYGPSGWRDPQATQTYLLKNSVGNNIRSQSVKDLRAEKKGKKLPFARGDVIRQVMGKSQGFLYYTGAKYAWFNEADPRATVAVAPGSFHGSK